VAKKAAIVLGAIFAVLLFFYICLEILVFDGTKMLKEIESPDHMYVAYLYTRDMGATTKVSYQLSIYKQGTHLWNRGGNIYIAEGKFDIDWTANNELKVTLFGMGKVFKQETKYKDVTIRYTVPGVP